MEYKSVAIHISGRLLQTGRRDCRLRSWAGHSIYTWM